MSTAMATGLSKHEHAKVAAGEALAKAKEKLGKREIDLLYVCCSSEYDYQEVLNTLREATDNVPLIGSSSSGEFTEEGVEKGSIAISLLSSDDIKFFTGISQGVKENTELAVKKVARELPAEVEGYPYLCALLLVDGLAGVGEEITLLASTVFAPEIKIIGGMAGDDFKMEKTVVFCNDKVITDGLAVCLLASKMPLYTAVKHGHAPLSEPLKATKVKDNILYEINGIPAWQMWKKRTSRAAGKRGIDVEQLSTPSEIGMFLANYELGLPTEKEGEYKVRYPSGINEDDSINFSCGIAQGSIFRIMDGSRLEDQMFAAEAAARLARQTAENSGYKEFAGLLVFECAVRLLMLGDKFQQSVEGLKKVFPDLPVIGFETYGEIRMEPGQFSGYHNTTSVVLLIPDIA